MGRANAFSSAPYYIVTTRLRLTKGKANPLAKKLVFLSDHEFIHDYNYGCIEHAAFIIL